MFCDPKVILERVKAEDALNKACQTNAAKHLQFCDLRDLRDKDVVILLKDGRLVEGRVMAAISGIAAIDLRRGIHHPQGGRLRLTPAEVACIDLAGATSTNKET